MCKQKASIMKKLTYQQGKTCHYCGKKLYKNMTLDHLLPISRGGQTVLKNLTICCSKCNSEKGSMTEQEYLHYLEVKKLLKSKMEVKALNNLFMQDYSSISDLSSEEIISFLKKDMNNGIPDSKFVPLRMYGLKLETEGTINITDVKITDEFKQTPPKDYKVKKAINYYNIHNEIDKPLTILRKNDEENVLIDGYSRYYALQSLNIPIAPAKFYSVAQ